MVSTLVGRFNMFVFSDLKKPYRIQNQEKDLKRNLSKEDVQIAIRTQKDAQHY